MVAAVLEAVPGLVASVEDRMTALEEAAAVSRREQGTHAPCMLVGACSSLLSAAALEEAAVVSGGERCAFAWQDAVALGWSAAALERAVGWLW